MNVWIIESRMVDVLGAEWRPWDGRGWPNEERAIAEKSRLEKKRHVVEEEFRLVEYTPVNGTARQP